MYMIGPNPDDLRAHARECEGKALEAAFDDEQEVAGGYAELAVELRWEADEAEFYEAQIYADCRFPAERAERRDGWDDEDDDPRDDLELHLALEREQERIRLSQGF